MGIGQEVGRSDLGEAEKPQSEPPAVVAQAVTKTTDFPRRPDSALDTPASPTGHNVVIRELPVRVTRTSSSARDTDTIEITESFAAAVSKIERKLDDYAKANGAKVEETSLRLSATGTISRIWNRSGIAELLRRTFPVHAYDITREEAGGAEKKVCQVRVTQGFFSPGITVTVTPYRGGAQEARTIEREFEKQAPTAELPPHAEPDDRSALEVEIAQRLSAQEERRIALERIGLGPEASEPEVQRMQRLIGQMENDAKDIVNGRTSNFDVSTQSKTTNPVLQRSYSIQTPKDVSELLLSPMDQKILTAVTSIVSGCASVVSGAVATGLYLNSVGPVATLCATGLSIGLAVVAVCADALFARLQTFHPNRYIGGSLRSKEPGSLGAVVDYLHKAGFNCDIRVGECDFLLMKVDLTVSYKSKN